MEPMTPTSPGETSQDETARKAYQRPELVVYGDLSDLTQAVDMMGAADGGMGMTNKT